MLSITQRVVKTVLEDVKEEVDEIFDRHIDRIVSAERDMTREESIEIIQKLIGRFKSDSRTYKALEMAIQALSQEPCDDAISRDAAINIASLHCLTIDETVKALEQLPSVTQKSETVTEFADRCRECGKRYVKIPDNATNGDMFRVFFPNGIEMQDLKNTTERWWNAPYQKGGK